MTKHNNLPEEFNYKFGDFDIFVVFIPSSSSNDHELCRLNDDRTVDVPKSNGTLWFNVNLETKPVAHAVFGAGDIHVRCDSVDVEKAHQSKGLATEMYDRASRFFGMDVVPSDNLSVEAERFWEARQQSLANKV